MTTLRDGEVPPTPGATETRAEAEAKPRKLRANGGARPPTRKQAAGVARTVAREAKVVRRSFRAAEAPAPTEPLPQPAVPAAEEGTLLTAAQLREAKKLIRERATLVKKEREFGRRLVATLTEGQNALNIAFGAILSAYIGTMLAAIDDKPFNQWTLAGFFGLIGVFIGGLCIGNLVVLRKHFGLGICFLATGAVAAWGSLDAARSLGFELPILKVMYVCWYAMLIATDGLLTAIVFFHHRSVLRREAQIARAAKAAA